MKQNKLPPIGTVFLVKLRDDGYATGVLVCKTRGWLAFGYFFGPRVHDSIEVKLEELTPNKSILICKFGGLGFKDQSWPCIGTIPNFSFESWPLMPLVRVDEIEKRAWIATYNDKISCIKDEEIPFADASRYPSDSTPGSGALEIMLTRLIKAKEA